jgi:hypothetical protein
MSEKKGEKKGWIEGRKDKQRRENSFNYIIMSFFPKALFTIIRLPVSFSPSKYFN